MTIEPLYPALGTAIRAYRCNRGLSQQDIADVLGFARVSSISDIEKGRVRLHVHHLVLLADLFECSVQALLDSAVAEQARSVEAEDQEWREYTK